MVVKKNKSKKKPSRPIRHKKSMKTIKKERYNKKSKQIRKKKSSRGVKKRTKKVNVMRGGIFGLFTSKTASTYGIKFLILPDKDTLDSEFIEAIKDLIGIVLYIPIYTFGNKTYYTLYKGFKIYYNKEKGSDLKIHIQNENKNLNIKINIMIYVNKLNNISIIKFNKTENSDENSDENTYKDHNITLYGNFVSNSIYYKKDEIKYTNKQILNEINNDGTTNTFGEIIIEDNFSDITKYYFNLHSILNYFLKDYMIFKGITQPQLSTNFKYDLEKLLNLLFYYDSTKKNIDFTEQKTIEILYTFIIKYKYKYNLNSKYYEKKKIEIIVSIFNGLLPVVKDLDTNFCILHALIMSFLHNYKYLIYDETITRDIIEIITSTKIEGSSGKYEECKNTLYKAITDFLNRKNKELQEIKKAEEKANEEQKRKEQLEKDEDTFKQNKAHQNKAHQKLHSFTIDISYFKNIRPKLIENTFAIALTNNYQNYIILYYDNQIKKPNKASIKTRKVKSKGWKKDTEILKELDTFLTSNGLTHYTKLDSENNIVVDFDYKDTIEWWDKIYPTIEWIHPDNSKIEILNDKNEGTFFVKEYCHQNSKIQLNHNYILYFRNNNRNDTYLVDIYPFYAHINKIKDKKKININITTNIKKNTNEKIPMNIQHVIEALKNPNSPGKYEITPDWPVPLIGYVNKNNEYVSFELLAPK